MFRREQSGAILGLFFAVSVDTTLAWSQTNTWEQQIEAGKKAYSRAQYAEAENRFAAALREAEKFGPEDARLATSLNELGLVYSAQDKYAEAEPLFRRALAIREKALGPDHADVARTLNNLAALHRLQNQPAEAEPLIRRALGILEKALGPEHPEVAGTLNNLAGRYRDRGKFAEAEPLFKRSLAIREKVLGPEHPDLTKTLLGMAAFYADQGKYAEAEPLLERSLAILEKAKAFGPNYPNVPEVLTRYAELLRKTNREAKAREMESRATALRAPQAAR